MSTFVRMMNKGLSVWAYSIAAVLMVSCKTAGIISATQFNLHQDYCAPTSVNSYSASNFPVANTDSLLAQDTLLKRYFSKHVILMANGTGMLKLLYQAMDCKRDTSLRGQIRMAEIKNEIQQRITLFRTELDGVAAELDCQGERSDQLASYLDDLNRKRNTRLTIGSIILGSVTTVATVVAHNGNAQNTISIAGGLLTAGLGATTINPAGKKVNYEHTRNLLEDIWFAPQSSKVYPPSVWYILTNRNFTNNKDVTLAESIKKRWTEFQFNSHVDSAKVKLLFRGGGIYTADDLHIRSNMLNQLQSTIRSVTQDLQGLLLAIDHNL